MLARMVAALATVTASVVASWLHLRPTMFVKRDIALATAPSTLHLLLPPVGKGRVTLGGGVGST